MYKNRARNGVCHERNGACHEQQLRAQCARLRLYNNELIGGPTKNKTGKSAANKPTVTKFKKQEDLKRRKEKQRDLEPAEKNQRIVACSNGKLRKGTIVEVYKPENEKFATWYGILWDDQKNAELNPDNKANGMLTRERFLIIHKEKQGDLEPAKINQRIVACSNNKLRKGTIAEVILPENEKLATKYDIVWDDAITIKYAYPTSRITRDRFVIIHDKK
jgi:hypothetical protein